MTGAALRLGTSCDGFDSDWSVGFHVFSFLLLFQGSGMVVEGRIHVFRICRLTKIMPE